MGSSALREALAHTGVTVTCLVPNATDTEFSLNRVGMLATKEEQVRETTREDWQTTVPARTHLIGHTNMPRNQRWHRRKTKAIH